MTSVSEVAFWLDHGPQSWQFATWGSEVLFWDGMLEVAGHSPEYESVAAQSMSAWPSGKASA